jgi:hypothetical protein
MLQQDHIVPYGPILCSKITAFHTCETRCRCLYVARCFNIFMCNEEPRSSTFAPLFGTVGIFFLSDCSSSRQASQPTSGTFAGTHAEGISSASTHLQHFIEGAALDAKGSFAEAVLEYQEALQSDQNASIYFAISRDYLLLSKFERCH